MAKTTAFKPNSQDVSVKIGETALVLRFSFRAFMALRDKWGLSDDEPDAKDAQTADDKIMGRLGKVSIQDFPVIFWAATRTHHPELTEDDVVNLIDDGGVEGLTKALTDVISASQPPKGKDENPPKAAAAKR